MAYFPSKKELQENIFCVKSQLERIMGSLESRYTEIPTDIGKKMQNLKQFAQNAEEMVTFTFISTDKLIICL